jgi:LCP family protein required for cell wall assembly
LRRFTAIASIFILALSSISFGAIQVIDSLGKNIQAIDTSELDKSAHRPNTVAQTDTSSTNLLIMGSDKRSGKGNTGYGYVAGARSDTTLLVHIYEGRKSALVVSIPRDSYVTIPKCTTPSGGTVGPWTTKFNAAFSIGGPICTIKAIEKLTGIRVNNFVVVDFNAFKTVVDTLGGVQVCFTTPVYDPVIPGIGGSGLNLPAGYSTLHGQDALKFVRARESLGDGSDLGRITRQQEFVSSMLRGIERKGLLTNPPLLYSTADVVTQALTTSKGFANIHTLENFALSLTGLSAKNIKLVATPYILIGDGNVHWTAKTEALWAAIRNDQPWPPVRPSSSPSTSGSLSPSPTPSASNGLITPPEKITIEVLNGTKKPGLAKTAAKQLKALGFKVAGVSTSQKNVTKTEIRYNPNYLESARTAAFAARATTLVKNSQLTKKIQIVVGPNWTSARQVVLAVSNANSGDATNIINAGTATCTDGNNRVK